MYKSVKIGEQEWMAENLNVDYYRNGDKIPEIKDPEQWNNLKTGAWCYYDNDPENGKKYGKLYNWYAVNDPRGLAPEGWHIPEMTDFGNLVQTVIEDGNALKAIGQGIRSGEGTNTSEFSALLAGFRIESSIFSNLGLMTNFWSSTEFDSNEAFLMVLNKISREITWYFPTKKEYGLSVRCLKD
jgi:uncharacterized protein (TIGR02145 family)